MKRVITIIAAFLLVFTSTAQTTQKQHLKFKGVPIEGNFSEFVMNLVQKGFQQISMSADNAILVGNFMAVPGVTVVVWPNPASKAVSSVNAFIPAGENWPEIKASYYNTVKTYTEKYGAPSEHEERFTTNPENNDYLRKVALREGRCIYFSLWKVEGGVIRVSLTCIDFQYYVRCEYLDEQNEDALHKTILDEI